MPLFTRPQVHSIGLDIGHDGVRMIQLGRAGETLSVRAAARAALPPEARSCPGTRFAHAAKLVRQMLRRNGFKGRRVVTTLPREVVHVRHLRLPRMPEEELAAAVHAEAKGVLPFDISETQLRFIPAGDIRQSGKVCREVILFAARDKDIHGFIEVIREAGVVLGALDVEECAAYRAVDRFVRRRDDGREVHAIVDVGAGRTGVVIGVGREMRFVKSIGIGGNHFDQAVSRDLGITAEEAQALRFRLAGEDDAIRDAAADATRGPMEDLAREISRCLRYYAATFRGRGPTGLRLIGGQADDPRLREVLNKMLAIPAEVARPLASLDTSRMGDADRAGGTAAWGVALGLALKDIPGTYGPRDGKRRETTAVHSPTRELAHA